MQTPSETARAFADLALRHAMRAVVPDGGPLVPFALLRTDGALSLRWCLADDLADGVVAARAMVRDAVGAECAAVAWDEEQVSGDRRACRVYVEVAAGSGTAGALYGQAYRDRRLLRPARVLGEPELLARTGPLY